MVPCGSSPVTRVSRSPLPASSLGASFFAWFDIVLYSVVACFFKLIVNCYTLFWCVLAPGPQHQQTPVK